MDEKIEKRLPQIKTTTQKSTTMQSTETSSSDIFNIEYANLNSINKLFKINQNALFSQDKIDQNTLIYTLRSIKKDLLSNITSCKSEELRLKTKLSEIKEQTLSYMNSYKSLTNEIEQLKEMNFIVENKIEEYEFAINKTEKEINHSKLVMNFVQIEDCEKVFPHNIGEEIILKEMQNEMKLIRKKMIILTHEQKHQRKNLFNVMHKVKEMNKDKTKMIYKISEMIEEDEIDAEDEIIEQTKNERLSEREFKSNKLKNNLHKDEEIMNDYNSEKGLTDRQIQNKTKLRSNYT